MTFATVGVKLRVLPYAEVSWQPGRDTSSAGKRWGDARPCLQLVNSGLGAEYMFLLLINERNYNFREKEAADCGDRRLSVCFAKVSLLWAG